MAFAFQRLLAALILQAALLPGAILCFLSRLTYWDYLVLGLSPTLGAWAIGVLVCKILGVSLE